jgi:hypothetical protein
MIHECLQGDIISENCLGRLSTNATISTRGMRRRRIELRQQETCLRTASIANNKTRQRETISYEFLSMSVSHLRINTSYSIPLHLPWVDLAMRQSSHILPDPGIPPYANLLQFRRGRSGCGRMYREEECV